jgi:antirestriction protein ArdC
MDGCKIRAGEKATAVEYWLVRDTKLKKNMTYPEYEKLLRDDPTRKSSEFYSFPKTAYVFNAAQVEGLQPLPQPERGLMEEDQLADEVVKTMSENMGVRLIYGGDEAYYSPATDTIHLPPDEAFHSNVERVGVTLHELSHATSAPSRLDRAIVGFHTDPEQYAMEELRAEIASTFVCGETGLEMPEAVIKNHMAYVSSWLAHIKQDHNALFAAIKDADKIADYMVDKGRVDVLREKLEIEAQMPKPLMGTTYEIWQLRDMPEDDAILFSDFSYASLYRLTESRYDKVYEAPVTSDTDTLDKLYVKFNIRHPADYMGRSLSVSDVVVLNENGKRTAWFCDTFGFREVPGFCKMQHTEKRGKKL